MISEENAKIAETLCDFIKLTDDEEIKYALSEVRYNLVCDKSKIGVYNCSIKPPFSNNVPECDICLENELYELWRNGVHTVSSCCGHGKVAPYIQVLRGDSVQKMNELGYMELKNEVTEDTYYKAYYAKTYLPCFSGCKDCRNFNNKTHVCRAHKYDINLKWCFRPKTDGGKTNDER